MSNRGARSAILSNHSMTERNNTFMENTNDSRDELRTIQIGRPYVELLKKIVAAKVPKTSMRQYTEEWIIAEAEKAGLITKKG